MTDEKEPIDWVETAWEYELAVECELGPDGEKHGYFRSIDDRVSHHNWFRVEMGQARWALVTEDAVLNAIENSRGEVRLREPDALLSEIETPA